MWLLWHDFLHIWLLSNCCFNLFFIQATVSASCCVMQRCNHVDLHPEWSEMAKKQLKGGDPAKKLIWHTLEVNWFHNLFSRLFFRLKKIHNVKLLFTFCLYLFHHIWRSDGLSAANWWEFFLLINRESTSSLYTLNVTRLIFQRSYLENFLTRGVLTQPCTLRGRGPFVSMQVSAPLRRVTSSIEKISKPVSRVSALLSTLRPIEGMTRTIPASSEMSAWQEWQLIRLRTWRLVARRV